MINEIRVAVSFILALGFFAWALHLQRQSKVKTRDKVITWILFIIGTSAICFSHAYSGDRTIHYNEKNERTGYSVREGNRESKFDSYGNRLGYSIHSESKTEHFDSEWNRQGHDEYDEPQTEEGDN